MPTMTTPYWAENPPELEHRYRENAQVLRNKHWCALNEAFKASDRVRLRRRRDAFFKNEAHKVAYLYEAGIRQPNVRSWEIEAAAFDPLCPIPHVIDWWRKPKKAHGFRLVCDFSPLLKAAHMMVSDVIRAQMKVPTFIYNLKRSEQFAHGVGRNALVQQLLAQLRAGFTHYRIYDARDCFNSINPGALTPPNLPLPWRIYENTINHENLNFRHDTAREGRHFADITFYRDIINAEGASGPDGLMQGSPSSNVVLAYLLQNVPQPDPMDGCILLFGDDLIALSRTSTIADRVDNAVTRFFGQPTLGPLQLQRRAIGNCGNFEYLGYEFLYSEINRDWHVSLSAGNWQKLGQIRNEEALRHWPLHGTWVDNHVARRMMRSLAGHPALTEPENVCKALVRGGWDHYELNTKFNERTEEA